MKAIAQRRARIARVRNVQHLQAAAAAHAAESHVMQLEMNAERLIAIRSSLSMATGATTGAALANAGEIAQRLDRMRDGLAAAIVGARATAEHQAAIRLEARKKQESADKLDQRAADALARWRDRPSTNARPRRQRYAIDEDQP